MGDGSLSQDEIDALLQGADDMLSSTGPAAFGVGVALRRPLRDCRL